MTSRAIVTSSAALMAVVWAAGFVAFGQTSPADTFFPYRVFYVSHAGVEDLEWEFSIAPGSFEWVPLPASDIQTETICRSAVLPLPFEAGVVRSRVPDQGAGAGPSEWIEVRVPEPAAGLGVAVGSLFLGCLVRARGRSRHRRF